MLRDSQLWMKIGRICTLLAKRLEISPERAFDIFQMSIDLGTVDRDFSPIPEQQFHAAGVHVEFAGSFIVLHTRVLSALRHSYSGLSCFLMIRSGTFFDGSKGFILFPEEYNKIRTLLLSEKSSDFVVVVHLQGLEPWAH